MSSASTLSPVTPAGRTSFGLIDRAARSAVLTKLAMLHGGRIAISDGLGQRTVDIVNSTSDLSASIRVHHPQFYRRAAMGGSLGAAAAYLDGDWSCDDLTSFFRIFVRAGEAADEVDGGLSSIGQSLGRMFHRLRKNTPTGSRRNIHDHYDLGNEFFALFLDETMSYSCAVFDRPDMTLHEASIAKLDRVCRKLKLSPADHLIEIGSGWGGLAEHAATNFGCRVTTTTISKKQYDAARQRLAAAGLNDRVTVLLDDYRDLTGQYDKLVSIEMIEAVGHEFLPAYFRKCSDLLKPGGVAVVQAITLPDNRYERYRRSTDFIQRYIFPGSCVPSMAAMQSAIDNASDLRLVDRDEIGPHYAITLRAWRTRFFEQIDRVRALGYPERFIRMWDYYLCYCEAGFIERYIGNSQLTLAKPAKNGAVL